jgi:hypothetical protein
MAVPSYSARHERLINQYGELLTCEQVAEVLKYANAAAVRKAHAAGNLPIRLFRLAGRRPYYADASEVARVIDAAANGKKSMR